MRRLGTIATALVVLALALLFLGERVVAHGPERLVLAAIGGVLLLAGLAARGARAARAPQPARRAERVLLAAKAGVTVALVLYALTTPALGELAALGEEAGHRVRTALGALWPAVLAVSLAALLFMELAYRKMPVAEAVELRRVRGAGLAGTGLALALVFLFSVNYATSEEDIRKDLSYFRTTRPSESTQQMVRQLGEPLRAVLFYPEVNEVLGQLRPYFDTLDELSEAFDYEVRDHALAPGLARRHDVEGNGRVALIRGEGKEAQAETFEIGTSLTEARSELRELDGTFQQAFSELTRQRRRIYLTAGHRERTDSDAGGDARGSGTQQLRSSLKRSNIRTKELGMAQGLGDEVPEDARAVAVIGPRDPFLRSEAESLVRYVEEGGRLVVMVDPTAEHGLEPLLHGLGVQLLPGVLASERHHVRRTHTKADRAFVFAKDFGSHPTVSSVARSGRRMVAAFLRGGALERHRGDEVVEGAEVAFPIESAEDFWRDENRDWVQDASETTGKMKMMAAVRVPNEGEETREGRAVLIPDGDFVTDRLIRNAGNALIFSDIMQWLVGQEQVVEQSSSTEDVRIKHTRAEDKLWFYGTSFGVPLPLLAIGVWQARRRRRGRRRETHRGDEPARETSREDAA